MQLGGATTGEGTGFSASCLVVCTQIMKCRIHCRVPCLEEWREEEKPVLLVCVDAEPVRWVSRLNSTSGCSFPTSSFYQRHPESLERSSTRKGGSSHLNLHSLCYLLCNGECLGSWLCPADPLGGFDCWKNPQEISSTQMLMESTS